MRILSHHTTTQNNNTMSITPPECGSIYLVLFFNMVYSRKKLNRGKQEGLSIYLFERSTGIFTFLTLPLEIKDKPKFHPWKLHKFLLHPSEVQRPLHDLIPFHF